MSLTRKWEGTKEDWSNRESSATIVYSGPWSSRESDKNGILDTAHPSYSRLKASHDSIEPWGDASDAGGPMTARHTVTYVDPSSNSSGGDSGGGGSVVQNAQSDWTEHWEAGGEAITIGTGFKWSSDGKKLLKEDVAAVKLFPSATISLSGTTSRFNSGAKTKLLNCVGKINKESFYLKGHTYAAGHLLYLGTSADELGVNATGSDLYRVECRWAYRHENTWNEFWRDDKAGGPAFDRLEDDNGKYPYSSDINFSDTNPAYW